MLTLRTVRLQARLPRSGLCCPLERECSAYLLNYIVPRLQLNLYRQQTRPYLFIPLSWPEARERLERWLERTESRIVKVSLLKRREQSTALQVSDAQQKRRKPKNSFKKQHRSHRKLMKWKHLMRKKQLHARNQLQTASSLPLPSSQSPLSPLKVVQIRTVYQRWKMLRKNQYQLWKDRREEQYQRWKSRREAQYQGWKCRRQSQYQGWKSRRQAQYQRWNIKRSQEWIKGRQVLLEEYSKSEWFDALGRPLTARDSTGRFVNPWQSQSTNGVHSLETIIRWRWQRFVRENMNFLSKFMFPPMQSDETNTCMTSSPLLTQTIPPLPVPNKSNLHFTWIGHSTCLFQVKNNFTILTDPMFSTRASPYKSYIGVPRDVPPACSIQELIKHQAKNGFLDDTDGRKSEQNCDFGKLDICCITHDHYDHMDTESVQNLKHHVELWVVPLGIGNWLVESCSIDRQRIVELQWWQQLRVGKRKGRVVVIKNHSYEDKSFVCNEYENDEVLTITCCPSSHWAGRTILDRNLRLWCSFAFSVTSFKFFFCGDSGYPNFPLFRQIGDTLGPFDLSCIPIGAYEPKEMNKDSHCNPQEAVKIHKDLHSKHSVAIHWGSFQLTEESMGAPPHELEDAIRSERQGHQHINKLSDSIGDGISYSPINFSVLGHGETLVLKDEKKPHSNHHIH